MFSALAGRSSDGTTRRRALWRPLVVLLGVMAVLAAVSASWMTPTAKSAPGGISPTAPVLDGFIDQLYGSPDASISYTQTGANPAGVNNGLIAVLETADDYYIAFQQPLTIKTNAYCANTKLSPGCYQNFGALVGSDHISFNWANLGGKAIQLGVDIISENPKGSGNFTGRLRTTSNSIGEGLDPIGCPSNAIDGYSAMDWNWNVAQWHDQSNSPNFAGQPDHAYVYPSVAEVRINKAGCGLPTGLKDAIANTVSVTAHNSPDSSIDIPDLIQCATPTPPPAPVGTPQTFTIKVVEGAAAGGFPVPLAGEHVLTFLQGPGTIVSVNGVPGTTGTSDASGLLTVVVNSTGVGDLTLTAVLDRNNNGLWDQADEPITTPGCLAQTTQVAARISITPDGINEVNHNHTFTAKVETQTNNGPFSPAPQGTVIDFAKTGVGGFVGGTASCTTPDASGSCSVSVVSPVVGSTEVSATSTVNVGGSNIKVSTDPAIAPNGPGGSGNAIKHWVDGYIKVTPNGLNPVNVEHVFNVEFGLLGNFDDINGVAISTSVVPNPANQTSTCATPTKAGSVYTCTLTINSPDPGLFLADATGTATLTKAGIPGSATLTRSTDPAVAPSGPGGNDGAQKQYENARISITPDGINEINHNHTFTGKVETQLVKNGPWNPAPQGTVIDFAKTGVGDFVGGTDSCTTPDASGSCSVSTTSPVTGSTTVSATSTVNVGGKDFKVSTDPAIAPNGPGGSDNAIKHWVDGFIKVTPDGVNPVGQEHKFTVEFGLLGSFDDANNVSIVPNVSPVPATQSDTCATPTAGANHVYSCTITINSPDPGVFKATATGTATLTKNGIPGSATLTRITDATHHGPGGNEGATKVYGAVRISITPDGINEITHNHTFTGKVETQTGNGAWVPAPQGTVIDFAKTGVGGFVGGTDSCTTPDASGSCSVSITSAQTGSTAVSATSIVNIGGKQVKVSTDPAIAPNGPGGSDNAIKHWVDGFIKVTPDAVNPVGKAHVFNVEFGLLGSFDNASNVSITPNVSPVPATQSSTCATPTAGANHVYTCTITINSPDPGAFKATATGTATLTKAGIPGSATLTRATDATSHGPGGNEGATKLYQAVRISITPDGINEVNHNHTFTAKVEIQSEKNGPWTAAPQGTVIDFAKTGVGDFVGGTDSCTTPDASGSCSVSIVSPAVGSTEVSATSIVNIGGNALKVSTDPAIAPNGPGGSDNAVKHWVDGYIKVTPDAVNPVNEQHVFNVEFGLLGSFDTASNVSITPNVSPAPATQSDTCGTPVAGANHVYTCTITINSPDPGVFKATATGEATLTKAGIPGSATLTRATDATSHGPGGNEGATKVYEAARISITPDGINEINHNHTFTATVETKTGNADWVKATQGTVIDFAKSGVGDFVGGTDSCTTPDASGSCSVSTSSPVIGSTTVSATSTIDVGTKKLTVSTDPAIAPNGPGGSDNAVKHWVDGYIKVTPDAVNPVNAAHKFTVEFGLLGNFDDASNVSITPNVSPAPATQSDTCDKPTVGANHVYTCTITINSPDPGVFKATATGKATLTKAGIPGSATLTRATDATSHGPGGNEGATKVYVDAFVTIGPSATNPVNVAHTFDVKVTAIQPGTGLPVAFDSIETSVEPSPLSESSTCATPTVSGDTATCTLTINSDVPGTFTANVTAKVNIGGAVVVRSTDSTVAPAGPGGSGPATKDYVQVLGEQFQRPLAVTGRNLGSGLLAGMGLLLGGIGLRRMRRRGRKSEM